MNCKSTVEMLSAYLDRELAPTERDAIRTHLAGCERCRCEEHDLRSLKGLLLGVRAPEPAADFEQRLMSRLQAEKEGPLPKTFTIPRLRPLALAPWGGLAAAAALAVIVVNRAPETQIVRSSVGHPQVVQNFDPEVQAQHSEAYWEAGDYPASPLMPTSYAP